MSIKKLDIKYILLTVGLFISVIVTYFFKTEIIFWIGCFLSWPYLNLVAGSLTSVITIAHKLKHRKINFKSSMSYSEFNAPFSELFSFILNPITIVGSLSLAKTLFFQFTINDSAFSSFSGIELTFISIVTAYLLFSSINEIVREFKEILFKITVVVETPMAIENQTTEVPQPESN